MIISEVKKQAKALDRVAPGWERKINPETLDLYSAHNCILGQVFGLWGNNPESINKGSTAYLGVLPFCKERWLRQVRKRLKVKAMEIGKPDKQYTIEPAEPVPGIKESPAPEPMPRKEPAKPEREKVPA